MVINTSVSHVYMTIGIRSDIKKYKHEEEEGISVYAVIQTTHVLLEMLYVSAPCSFINSRGSSATLSMLGVGGALYPGY